MTSEHTGRMFQDVATQIVDTAKTCWKHPKAGEGRDIWFGTPQPCPHCVEDEKILEEAISNVAESFRQLTGVPTSGADNRLRAALRTFAREIRR